MGISGYINIHVVKYIKIFAINNISRMNLLILFSLFVGLTTGIQSLDDKILVVERRTQDYGGSYKYGSGAGADYSLKTNKEYRISPTSYGSGVESKYSSKTSSSYNRGSHIKQGYSSVAHDSGATHRSYGFSAFHGYSKHGSNAKYGSIAVHGSNNHGSGAKHRSSVHGSKHGSGSIWHSSGADTRHGSYKMYSPGGNGHHRGSGANGGCEARGSRTRGTDDNIRYNLFSPTREPTESFPEVYKPPPPTNFPTDSSNFPKIKLSFNQPTSGGIEVPQIPLSFQIQQGANGWAQYPDSPPVIKAITKVAAKTAGVTESAITNMKIERKSRRALSTAVTITYDITTTPETVGLKSQQATYDLLIYKLELSVKSNNFSSELQKLGIPLNISSISFSEYTVFYPTMTPTVQQNVLTSGGVKNDNNKTEGLIIGIGLLLLFITGGFGVLWYRRNISKSNKKEVELEPRSENSMVDRPMSLARVSNPMIDIIPNQTNRISVDHINCPHNE